MSDQPQRPVPPPPQNDPMFKTLDNTGPLEKAARSVKSENRSAWLLPALLSVCLIGLLGYAIYLNVTLNNSQDRIQQLTTDLDSSDGRIDKLEEKLYTTETKLGKQIADTTQEFSTLHQQQTQEVDRIKNAVGQKADKTEVANVDRKAETISSDVGNLKNTVQTVDQSVKQVDTNVVDLGKKVEAQGQTIEEQRKLIEQNIHNINATRDMLDATRDSLANLKTSLDRDYFVFQLSKKSGIIKVKDIGLRLKKTKVKEQNYNIEVFYDDKKMSKDKVAANEPVYFFKMGYKKPYEVVISQVLDDKVTGYISIPKVTD